MCGPDKKKIYLPCVSIAEILNIWQQLPQSLIKLLCPKAKFQDCKATIMCLVRRTKSILGLFWEDLDTVEWQGIHLLRYDVIIVSTEPTRKNKQTRKKYVGWNAKWTCSPQDGVISRFSSNTLCFILSESMLKVWKNIEFWCQLIYIFFLFAVLWIAILCE